MSRRVSKSVNGSVRQFLYDGWNLISEVGAAVPSGSSFTNVFTRGLDLSGSLQGAGGIGALLSASLSNPTTSHSTTVFYAYDANGNLTDLVGADGGAHYEYDPYGNTIAKFGALADANSFRFSTKYLDSEVGLYYYWPPFLQSGGRKVGEPGSAGGQCLPTLHDACKRYRSSAAGELEEASLSPPFSLCSQ
jgi:YD repeat-containing protein